MKGMIFTTPIPADREAAEVELAEKRRELAKVSELLDRIDELNTKEGLAVLDAGYLFGGISAAALLEQRVLLVDMGAQRIMQAHHDANRRAPNRKSMRDAQNVKLMQEARIQVARELGVYDVEILIEHDTERFEAVVYQFYAKNMVVDLG